MTRSSLVLGGRLERRPFTSGAATPAGLQRTLVIRNNVLWLKPMRSVYIGPNLSNGGLFKWRDSQGHGMRVAMTGNTIRVDKVGAWGSLTSHGMASTRTTSSSGPPGAPTQRRSRPG